MDLILIRSLSFNINIGSAQTYNSLSAQGNLQSNVWIFMKSILLSNRMKSIFPRLKSRFCSKVVISTFSLRISKWQLIPKINLSVALCLSLKQGRLGTRPLQDPGIGLQFRSQDFCNLAWHKWQWFQSVWLVFIEADCDEIQLCGASIRHGFWKK